MTKQEIINYVSFLKTRNLQAYFAPLIQLLMQHKDNHGIFNTPVDPDVQNLPTYYSIIKKPMDLGTVRDRLASGYYTSQSEIMDDISLVFRNAQKFNPAPHFIYLCASSLSKVFESEAAKIQTRIEQNRVNQANHFCSSCRGTPCRICGEKCLRYSPPVFVCDGDCHGRILRCSTYYIIRGQKGRYCQKCYAKKIAGMDKADRKNLLVKKKNDEMFPESWVQCSRCHEWLHCICGLVHPRQVTNNYVCPICLSEDPRRIPKPVQGAAAIPTCSLSEYLTERVRQRVDEVVQKLPKRFRPSESEQTRIKQSLIVRVVSNITTSVTVKRSIAPLFTTNHSDELSLPYRSKCIAFFQHRNGVDILLFVLYVHEFDENTIPANRRCVYISYLDSVHFLSPRYLRTPLYHTLLNGYLAYAKSNGYCRAHIWACPPSRGDDYIFPHHPRDQRTPNADHLIGWYRQLLAEAVEAGIVSHASCQLDELLHINAVRSNNPDINQRQIRCFSIREGAETELPGLPGLPGTPLERAQGSPFSLSSCSSVYETENENDSEVGMDIINENEAFFSSDISSMSLPTPSIPSIDSTTHPSSASLLASESLSELERVLLLTVPYFEGDYLPCMGEDIMDEIYQDSLKPKVVRSVRIHRLLTSRRLLSRAPPPFLLRPSTEPSFATEFSETTFCSCLPSSSVVTRSPCWRILLAS
ncbi:uncharacterized protein [Blastocystis hominis]|uniref:histone acetyltransferase n=1 Tax=Blastocystis hominis TaxID=12968 RepID=D8M6J5_BLAHO|nr:uncharacterized protein [Blastocystis hominis]CBK23413.2 unnamed protein product [Blastocystis hominis]|eukprot:XP_012897461.1 uncharacterized protein [Blastocystis hominis]